MSRHNIFSGLYVDLVDQFPYFPEKRFRFLCSLDRSVFRQKVGGFLPIYHTANAGLHQFRIIFEEVLKISPMDFISLFFKSRVSDELIVYKGKIKVAKEDYSNSPYTEACKEFIK
ncbi:MAG: hypothetical protein ACI90V_010926 [Bacillariaceae sp.]|jgi:hypothetical protein